MNDAAAVYVAMRGLLRAKSYVRLDLGIGDLVHAVCVGLHPGWGDGELVVIISEGGREVTELGFKPTDATLARNMAAALNAYADWSDEEAGALKEPGNAG